MVIDHIVERAIDSIVYVEDLMVALHTVSSLDLFSSINFSCNSGAGTHEKATWFRDESKISIRVATLKFLYRVSYDLSDLLKCGHARPTVASLISWETTADVHHSHRF